MRATTTVPPVQEINGPTLTQSFNLCFLGDPILSVKAKDPGVTRWRYPEILVMERFWEWSQGDSNS